MAALLVGVRGFGTSRTRILAVALIVLVAVLAIQIPRLLGGAGAVPPIVQGTVPPTAAVVAAPAQPTVDLAPTAEEAVASVDPGQLNTLSSDAPKDPFVPQIVVEQSGASVPSASEAAPVPAGAAAPVVAPRFATIAVDGVEERLAVDGHFPVGEAFFVLAQLDGRSARVSVVGGDLAHGAYATLELGRILTLEDAATGARYRLELLYLGDVPEQIRDFVSGKSLRAVASAN